MFNLCAAHEILGRIVLSIGRVIDSISIDELVFDS